MTQTEIVIRTTVEESGVAVDMQFVSDVRSDAIDAFNKVMKVVSEPLAPLSPVDKLKKAYYQEREGSK